MRLALGFVRYHPTVRRLLIAYAILNLLDLATTYAGLRQGGHEMVALYAALFATLPFNVGASIKLLVAAALLASTFFFACWRPLVSPHSLTFLRITLACLCALLAFAVISNIHALLTLAR